MVKRLLKDRLTKEWHEDLGKKLHEEVMKIDSRHMSICWKKALVRL